MGWIAKARQLLDKPASRWRRFFIDILLDLALINACLVLAFGLVFDFSIPIYWLDFATLYSLPITALSVVSLAWRGVYRINARYMGLYDFLNIASIGCLSGLSLALVYWLFKPPLSNPSFWLVPVLFALMTVATLCSVRIVQRLYDWKTAPRDSKRHLERRTLIIGAGDAGEAIVREISRSPHSDHLAVGFVDDDPNKCEHSIHGVPVLGPTKDIPKLVDKHSIEEIIIAVPSASGDTMRRLVGLCDSSGARVRTLPPIAQILNNDHHLRHHLREVEIEDLLRRPAAETDLKQTAGYINGETVLVTGGGGSIGSELARQTARFSPNTLVLFGKGENSIYEIEQEMLQTGGVVLRTYIGDVRDRQSLDDAMKATKPSVVFHAAAHKHVPLMQANVIEAVKNNVFGTYLTADAAIRHGVRKFVYISTDKAVRPSSVMGATKRVGEMIVRALAERSETEFAIVRFGNVLGSRGSLIPVLKSQIRRGGPIKLTHPDMTRYFMTIPEAVQLIMQAGALGSKGELFILDMGDPVKIVELAKDLIRLHGLVPGDDIEIQFTGPRPGEKMAEELLYDQEELEPTFHPKIQVVKPGGPMNYDWLMGEVQTLRDLCEQGDNEKVRLFLMELAWGKTQVPFNYAAIEPLHDAEPAN